MRDGQAFLGQMERGWAFQTENSLGRGKEVRSDMADSVVLGDKETKQCHLVWGVLLRSPKGAKTPAGERWGRVLKPAVGTI